MGGLKWCVLFLGVLLLTGGCGGSEPPVTAVTLPSGWQTVKQGEFVFALPPAWEVVSAEEGGFESALDDLVRENPRLQGAAEQGRQAMAGGQIELMAFDLAPENASAEFTTNLSMGQQALDRLASLEEVATANERQLQASGFTEVRRTTATIGGQQMARLSSTLQLQAADQLPLDLALEQYIVVRKQQQYIVTFTTTTALAGRMRPVFEQIMTTFQIS